ncbi:MAG TPA: hypothetical protein ENJ45_01255, partial [Phaeodactylibacter sp.]|nr:hypothetical protein [Phaeodactylibacter sp.]
MNLKSTLIKSISLVLLFAAASSLPAQVFWSEDFSGGMPADWTTVDTSGHEVIWSWCGDPLGTVGDCSPIFDDDINGQSPFAATTSDNGFMTVNSDAYNTPASDPHVSILATNAIDCSAQSVVWIKFEAHIGVFDLDANTNAFLRVSTDSITWTDYACFPDLTTTVRWSENPEDVIFDLTDVAAGQSTVYLQWIWTGGWEYFWNLDDVILTSVNPTPPHDIQVNSNWFAIAPNARVPVTQIEQFGFIADVENEGSLNQTNVNLRVTIEDEANLGTFLYDETLGYGTVDAGTLVENVLFPDDGFTPAASVATYVGTYAITSDSSALDAEPEDNTITFDFEVTENLFAKDRGVTRIISPA